MDEAPTDGGAFILNLQREKGQTFRANRSHLSAVDGYWNPRIFPYLISLSRILSANSDESRTMVLPCVYS